MSGKPYRLPATHGDQPTGRLIDREARLSFTFDSRRLIGFAGDTLASALLANGIRIVARSFKYHRPRGVISLGPEEPSGLVDLNTGGRYEPNVRITQVELYDGLKARSQNRWPSLGFDIGEINNKLSRMIPSGFYYKTFMWPAKLWPWYEHVIRRAAGLGRAPKERDVDIYEHMNVTCDVLVVGGGLAGLTAALAASAAGARVMLADENPRLGGFCDIDGGKIDGQPAIVWARAAVSTLAARENVHLLTRTTVCGHYDHNWLVMAERITDHNPAEAPEGTPRQRLWRVRAKQVVLATGAIERPLVFANNDRPGVMLAGAARGYVHRYGVSPGRRGVIFTNNDSAYRTAIDLAAAGVTVPAIIDARPRPKGALVGAAHDAGIEILAGRIITTVETSFGGRSIEGVRTTGMRASGRLWAPEERIECDFVCTSGGWNPAVHLWSHSGGKVRFDDTLQSFVPDSAERPLQVVGTANGVFALDRLIATAHESGENAAARALGERTKSAAPKASAEARGDEATAYPAWFIPSLGKLNEGNKHFVDLQNDVTAADVELAAREGYRSVEHLKRYTTLGMATDQGKTSNINALGILADVLGAAIPEVGTTTFRPPYTPLTFGAIAGSRTGPLFAPVRQTPIWPWHVSHHADFEPVGLWRRPYCYRGPNEKRDFAINREILAARSRVGIIDLSTLGKIEIKGPDAAKLLDRIYTNTFSTLKPGRCRYGLMLNENGFLFDDGVTVRLADDHFLMHTTSGNADHIAAWLEEWLQTEWYDLRVFITPLSEQFAQFAVAGPKARNVLSKFDGDIDFSAEAFAFLTMKEGRLAGIPVRVYRISFSGELSFEIAAPAGYGLALWNAILAAGEEYGISAYGTEALHVMRAEKGFIAIGDETDGTVTPLDLGLSWAVSRKKPDYIGKRSLKSSYLAGSGRKELVGILTDDPKIVLPDGAHAVAEVKKNPPMKMIGHVTSSYFSPTLDRSIAMALIRDGRARMGQTVSFPLEKKVVLAKIVDPVFYDKEGSRQDG